LTVKSSNYYPVKPLWNRVFSVSTDVSVDDDDGEKAGQRYQNHVHAEIRSCTSDETHILCH